MRPCLDRPSVAPVAGTGAKGRTGRADTVGGAIPSHLPAGAVTFRAKETERLPRRTGIAVTRVVIRELLFVIRAAEPGLLLIRDRHRPSLLGTGTEVRARVVAGIGERHLRGDPAVPLPLLHHRQQLPRVV